MKRCELLVPAGGMKQLIAAVENGADAVYLGGRMFNARMNAGNFDHEEIREAVAFAHKRGVKIYVTMNTLVTDQQMQEALDYAAFLYEIGVDALIVQDLGLGRVVGDRLPDFPLHLSTQGSVYDLRGCETAWRLGYERVVLARELSLEEIGEICAESEVEIEVFVHGAMCVCYSGQCQLSRYFGGRSGNLGQCAQPCRLPYTTLNEEGIAAADFRYPLSPKDLCGLEHIGQLASMGVSSLKVEGRMKSAEYVAVVTSIYRKYLDLYYKAGAYTVKKEDWEALEQIFNRGGFTEGYFCGNPGQALMAGDIPKHRGILIGKVEKRVPGTDLVDVKIVEPLSRGDGVEIQGRTAAGNVVTYYQELKNGLIRIGDLKGKISRGDPLYRISSAKQLEQARKTFENKTCETGKYLRKTPVEMDFLCSENGAMRLKISSDDPSGEIIVRGSAVELETRKNGDNSRIEKALKKTGNTPFLAEKVIVSNPANKNIPVSAVNEIRRRGLEALELQLEGHRKPVSAGNLPDFPKEQRAPVLEFYFYDWKTFERFSVPEELCYVDAPRYAVIPLVEFERHYDRVREDSHVIPYITGISKGKEDRWIEAHFDSIRDHTVNRGIYTGNLSWIGRLRNAGIPVLGDYGLNVYNRAAEAVFESLGVKHCAWSLESVGRGFGSFPLMISEHAFNGRWLLDRKQKKIRILRRSFSDQNMLISESESLNFKAIKEALSDRGGIVRIYVK